LLLLYFNSRTSKRFNKLSRNIVALGANKEIPGRLDGADELAMLDDVVHAVSHALKEAERSKQEVLAMVTHDLRSPLTSLQLTLNLLHSGSLDNSSDKAKNMIARADSSVGKLIQLINDLLDIDKIESGRFNLNMQETEDASMISQAVDLIQHSADARKITIEINAARIEVNCDEERIIRVLTNLIANAVKFSPDNSKIVVSTTQVKDKILFEVKDQGRGMPEGEQDRIFERYHQVDSSDEAEKKGSGLGLTICKALIEAHHGTIGATSKEGEGSTFWFRIPLGAETQAGGLEGATPKINEPNPEPIPAAKNAD
jgi:signal transduction histidine kinase